MILRDICKIWQRFDNLGPNYRQGKRSFLGLNYFAQISMCSTKLKKWWGKAKRNFGRNQSIFEVVLEKRKKTTTGIEALLALVSHDKSGKSSSLSDFVSAKEQ